MTRGGLAFLGALLVAAFFLYLPGTGGPYLADDLTNLAHNRQLVIESLSLDAVRDAALSSRASPWYRPLAMLSFALNYSLAGNLEPFSAKFFNVLLHLAAGVLVFFLVLRLLPGLRTFGTQGAASRDAQVAALFVTAFWLLHPLQVSTVLYTVQRMTILSALFTLAGCLWYLNRRPRAVCGRDVILLVCGIGVFTLLAFLCKETGALLPGFVLLVEATLFRFAFGPGVKAPARILLAASLCLPAVAILLYLCGEYFQHRDALAANWHFTGHERFLTQFRALLHYAGWIGLPGTAPMGLYHDDFPLSRGLVDPPATLFALFFWCAAFVGGIALARRRQVLGFGVLWFLWGHVIESSTIPLAPVFEHRNYLPGLGLALALGALLYEAMAQVRLGPATRHAILAAVLVLLPAVQLAERAGAWSDKAAFIERSLRDHPESALTLMTAAAFLNGHGNPEAAIQALREARRLDPRDASPALAEAAVRCEHWPGERFPDDLRRTLGSAGMERLRAATARLHFVFVARFCAVSSVNDDVLLPLYERHRESRNGNLAVASLFGAGVIYLRSGRTEEARAAWETALSGYPEGEAIRPWIEEFRRR